VINLLVFGFSNTLLPAQLHQFLLALSLKEETP
jgi:hypothetical protein